jgi:hypothetical protein
MLTSSGRGLCFRPGLGPFHGHIVTIAANLHSASSRCVPGFRFPFLAKAIGRFAHPSCQQSCQSGCYASRLWPLADSNFLFARIPPSQSERDDFSKRNIGGLNMETKETKNTCDQRIDAKLKDRLEQLLPDVETWSVLRCARYLKSEGQELRSADLDELQSDVREIVRERAFESLLSLDRIKTFKLCLSCGGPADYFELDWSEESKAWVGGRYLFQDWFDGANRTISADLAEQLADLYGVAPDAE